MHGSGLAPLSFRCTTLGFDCLLLHVPGRRDYGFVLLAVAGLTPVPRYLIFRFLCEYHFSLCEAIPAPAVQMRNLVLSAFPRNMRLPDPFTPNLKVLPAARLI